MHARVQPRECRLPNTVVRPRRKAFTQQCLGRLPLAGVDARVNEHLCEQIALRVAAAYAAQRTESSNCAAVA